MPNLIQAVGGMRRIDELLAERPRPKPAPISTRPDRPLPDGWRWGRGMLHYMPTATRRRGPAPGGNHKTILNGPNPKAGENRIEEAVVDVAL